MRREIGGSGRRGTLRQHFAARSSLPHCLLNQSGGEPLLCRGCAFNFPSFPTTNIQLALRSRIGTAEGNKSPKRPCRRLEAMPKPGVSSRSTVPLFPRPGAALGPSADCVSLACAFRALGHRRVVRSRLRCLRHPQPPKKQRRRGPREISHGFASSLEVPWTGFQSHMCIELWQLPWGQGGSC